MELPFLAEYELHIVQLWQSAGMVGQGAGGLTPLSWVEISKWAEQFHTETYFEWVEQPRQSNEHQPTYFPIQITQCTLLDDELQLIQKLSQEYSSEYSQASDPQRECPTIVFVEDVPEDAALANANAIADAFKMFQQ